MSLVNNSKLPTVSHQVAVTATVLQHHVAAIVLNTAKGHLAQTTDNNNNNNNSGAGKQSPGKGFGSRLMNSHQRLAKRRQQLEARRERKAAHTLAIITGAFVVCWLPFFVTALLLSLCKSCELNAVITSLFLWLGYFNSTVNPIIYTIFNPEFRRAFQRLLCKRVSYRQHQHHHHHQQQQKQQKQPQQSSHNRERQQSLHSHHRIKKSAPSKNDEQVLSVTSDRKTLQIDSK